MNDAIQVVQIEKADKILWDEFIYSATEGNIFQTFEWAEVMKKAGCGKVDCLAVKKNDEIIAGILLMTTTFKGQVIPFISSSMSREGPIIKCKKVNIHPLLNNIERSFGTRSNVTIDMPYCPFRSFSVEAFKNFNYRYAPTCTFLINLTDSLDGLWRKLEKRARWSVQQAEKKGVYVEILSDEEDLKKYYELYLRICQRAALGFHTYDFLRTAWNCLKREAKLKIFVAKHDEEVAAGAAVLFHKDKMWYWNAVSNDRLRKLCAPSLLLWSIIKAGHENGFHLLDLCGAMCNPNPRHPHYGPDLWKRGFGGNRVELGRYQKVFNSTFWSLRNKFVIPIEDICRYRRSIRR